MSLAWVAADVRASLLAQHRLGQGGVRALAARGSLVEALESLQESPYGETLAGAGDLADAQHRLAAGVLWNLRVLAGWLPPGGAEPLRALAAWFEIANVQARLAHFVFGGQPPPLFDLGALETAARRLDAATSAGEVRRVLSDSRWGDPGGSQPERIVNGMRLAWYRRVRAYVPEAVTWAEAAAVLWEVRARFGPAPPPAPGVHPVHTPEARSFEELAAALPGHLAWVLDGVAEPSLLWQAEARWWRRVERDALALRRIRKPGPAAVVATAALLAADAWRVRAALAAAAGPRGALEVLDAIA